MDLSTKYLGMQLRTPLVASASPISQELSGVRSLEDAGASAVVLYSLFEEQLHQEGLELGWRNAPNSRSWQKPSETGYLSIRAEWRAANDALRSLRFSPGQVYCE